MTQPKFRFTAGLLVLGLFLSLGVSAWTAEFPTKPISLIIPYPPGGSADLTCRGLAKRRQEASRPAHHL